MKSAAEILVEQSTYIMNMESAKRVLTGLRLAYVQLKNYDYQHFLSVIDMHDCEEARYLWRSFFVFGEILKACDLDALSRLFAIREPQRDQNVRGPYITHVVEDAIEP